METIDASKYDRCKHPGKFEGCEPFAEYYWEQALEGCSEDIGDGETSVDLFQVSAEESEAFELPCGAWVWVAEDSQGFVVAQGPFESRDRAEEIANLWLGVSDKPDALESEEETTMEIIERDIWFCDDCTLAAVNDDYSGLSYYLPNDGSIEAREAEIRGGMMRYLPGLVPDFDAESGEGLEEFSRRRCDCCHQRLDGQRHRFAVLGDAAGVAS